MNGTGKSAFMNLFLMNFSTMKIYFDTELNFKAILNLVLENMSFKIEDDEVYLKYNEIWNKINKLLGNIKLGIDVIYDDQYIKTKFKTFKMIKALFSDDIVPEEKIEHE